MNKIACIIGATGLVGSKLVLLLVKNPEYKKIKVFSRRSLDFTDEKIEEFIINFDNEESWKEDLKGDVLFSCLGTTLKIAGSKNEQFKIDFTYQFNFAKIASANQIKEYVLISSAGANSESNVFYSQMKGQLDQAVKGLDFDVIRIIKPSVLDGNRKEKRTAEKMAIKTLNKLAPKVGFLKRYKPIKDYKVAQAMINSVKDYPDLKLREYELDEVLELGNRNL